MNPAMAGLPVIAEKMYCAYVVAVDSKMCVGTIVEGMFGGILAGRFRPAARSDPS